MKAHHHLFLAGLIGFLSQADSLLAAVYTKASITQVYKDVRMLEATSVRPAKVNDTVSGERSVKTGIQSRAELIFDDQSMTRLGANTVFSFQQGSRDLEVKEGTILFEVPKRAGGASIRCAAISAAITGTTGFFEYSPKAGKDGIIKFGILEGSATLSGKGKRGRRVRLGPGEMLIMSAKPGSLDTVRVIRFNIQKFVGTCGLIKKMGGLGPVAGRLVQVEIDVQDKLGKGSLVQSDGGTMGFVNSQVDLVRQVLNEGTFGPGDGDNDGDDLPRPPAHPPVVGQQGLRRPK